MMDPHTKHVLHVGCGGYAREKLHPVFHGEGWREVRLDIDPAVQPDIIATMTDMSGVPDGSVDAVFSSHNLEHLYPHEVPVALREFRRVLNADGFALITLPDLQTVAALVAEGQLAEPLYLSGMGPISAIDILYGCRPALAIGNLFMAHHTGFTGGTLTAALLEAGFAAATVQRSPPNYCLWAIAFQARPSTEQIRAAQSKMFPLGPPP